MRFFGLFGAFSRAAVQGEHPPTQSSTTTTSQMAPPTGRSPSYGSGRAMDMELEPMKNICEQLFPGICDYAKLNGSHPLVGFYKLRRREIAPMMFADLPEDKTEGMQIVMAALKRFANHPECECIGFAHETDGSDPARPQETLMLTLEATPGIVRATAVQKRDAHGKLTGFEPMQVTVMERGVVARKGGGGE